ncbi:hypothetical protein R1sor_020142 [Riccia sorocarpa]|uniref:Uncharacterized protein n=1 Tax=Riccia sorocarpa TaxID=122646 RepID=A0ABD3IEG0_9MARC
MVSLLEKSIRLKCALTGECEVLRRTDQNGSVEIRESFLAIRFSLQLGTVFIKREIKTECGEVSTLSIDIQESSKGRCWTLHEGSTNVVYGLHRSTCLHPSKFVSRTIRDDVNPDGDDTGGTSASKNQQPECQTTFSNPITRAASEVASDPYPGWKGIPRDPYLQSAFDAAMSVSAACELGKLDLKTFNFYQVLELPQSYNGNVIFELPPVIEQECTKRNGFRKGMDRRNDCYLWTRLITTDAGHGRKKMFEVSHMSCVGSLQCSNLACGYKAKYGSPNVSDWPTGVHRDQKYTPGDFVPNGGHKCLHCGCRAICVKACYAKMYFVLPSKGKKTSPSLEQASHMSRCAVHVGTHCHSARSAAPRHLVDLMQQSVKEEAIRSPRSPMSVLRKNATTIVLDKLDNMGFTLDMTEDEKKNLFLGISSAANPEKILNMVKSIRRSAVPLGELSAIASMQQNTIYRTVQRSLFPGQADSDKRCHVFKMATVGPGSGVNLVNRMRPGGNLEGAWVMWNVMYRIDSGWCTMGIHVYDHVLRCLSTIAICELKAEDKETHKAVQQIEDWWKADNAIPSKLKEMQASTYSHSIPVIDQLNILLQSI